MRAPLLPALLVLPLLVAPAAEAQGLTEPPKPIDPQTWVLPQDMTWADYKPIPGFDWSSPEHQPVKKLRAALITADYPDRKFLVTEPRGSDVLGNPIGAGKIPREEVAKFY